MSKPDIAAALRSVTLDERRILMTLALAADSWPRSYFVACMKAAGWRRTNGSGFNNDNLGASLKALHDRKLIDFTGHAQMSPEVAWAVLLGEPRAALEPMVTALREHTPHTGPGRAGVQRELNLACLDHDLAALDRLIDFVRRHKPYALEAGAAGLFGDLPSNALAHVRASPLLAVFLAETLRVARQQLRRDDTSLATLEAFAGGQQALPLVAAHELCRQWILARRVDDAATLLARYSTDDDTSPALACWLALVRGEAMRRDQLDQALAAQARPPGDGPATLPGPERVVLELVRIAQRVPVKPRADNADGGVLGCRRWLDVLTRVVAGDELEWRDVPSWMSSFQATAEEDAWQTLCGGIFRALAPELAGLDNRARAETSAAAAGYLWLADELAPAPPKGPPKSTLVALFSVSPLWQRKLERLETAIATLRPKPAAPAASAKQAPEPDLRLVWLFEVSPHWVTAHPREQRRDARGKWSKGRRVALEHLFGGRPEYKHLSAADKAVCAFIRQDVSIVSGYRNISYLLDDVKGFSALAAHPHVYWLDDDAQPLVFRDAEPSLHIVRKGDGFDLRMEPRVHAAGDRLHKTGPYELTRVRANAAHESLAKILGAGLHVPASQVARVERIVAAVTGLMQVHSDLTGPAAAQVAADGRAVVQLSPLQRGLSVRVQVRPLGADGPALVPGQGARTLSAERGGKTLLVQRDLAAELAQVDVVLAACPALFAGDATDGGWQIADPAAAFELLLQLDALGEAVVVEWPAGKPLKVVGTADGKALRLKIAAATGGWFALSGELAVGEGQVLEIGELLRLVADSPHRFIALAPGALHRVDGAATRPARGVGRPRGAAARACGAAPVGGRCARVAGGRGLCADRRGGLEAERQSAARRSAAGARRAQHAQGDVARLPGRWLPLVGAPCAPRGGRVSGRRHGPWQDAADLGAAGLSGGGGGAARGVPDLGHRRLARRGGAVCADPAADGAGGGRGPGAGHRRGGAVRRAGGQLRAVAGRVRAAGRAPLGDGRARRGAGDQERADAACERGAIPLPAAFRVALTGTPIENRLEDLWAVFNFVVPGFLGTRARFVDRYVRPDSDGQGRQARQALKQLVAPLLLRRTKGEVLAELPARTEMVVRVALGEREAALYEALRQRALTSLAAHAAEPSGQRRVRVLAEITRLRRACCHPRLALKGAGATDDSTAVGELGALLAMPDAAKLAAFAELVEELRQGGHRALVYSQFVDHLEIVREWVAGQSISYQYLDGSTPQKQRQERVRAFQAGEGELFLISLRAGGTGLNLTGADFVIHLDPWWNPAVEDQASDRVYRIGQERPVTIVRLVVRGSIEERILDLHRTKRELADDLLADSEGAARLDVDGLVALLQGP